MPLVLRKIRRARWLPVQWLAAELFQADALSDLMCQGNKLSVWIIEDDHSNLEHVITALAANGTNITNIDYALISEESLREVGIKVEHTKGDSADESLNSRYHCDLVELSAQKLMELAKALYARAVKNRYSEKHVFGFLVEGIRSGRLVRGRIKLSPVDLGRIESQLSDS